ncbi:MAG: hypothetical protein JWL59_802 [Chthoniobacteraceae bacterium]|nr:hypothetical protein [Chthoniobacteraceae bacterium]
MTPRILVIRGGAIGDFILTLPAIKLMRENFPGARIEILGYKHIIALAEGRYYCEATRSIEYAPMAGFFVPGFELSPELIEYFSGFQQIVSYLYDPNGYFEANLRRAGAKNILPAYSAPDDSQHVTLQLARPLQQMALYLEDSGAQIYPNAEDFKFADAFLAGISKPVIAIHPGSGSPRKNWGLEKWLITARALLDLEPQPELLWVGGEADEERLDAIQNAFGRSAHIARHLPLPHLAAVLARCRLFLGHDSGISHLAAAVGTPSVLLFGPTDPAVWAPANPHVIVMEAADCDLSRIQPAMVSEKVRAIWNG